MSDEQIKRVMISRVIRETHDTCSLVLQPLDSKFEARSGQFLTFIFTSYSGASIRRSYSLSSSPELGEELTVTIKRVPNGEISRKLVEQAREGDVLMTTGASGLFVLPDHINEFDSILLFAAGSGITPIYSLIKTALHVSKIKKVVLIYSNRNIGDTIFHEQIRALEIRFPSRFEVHFLYSLSADLNRSRLTPMLLENFMMPYLGRLHKQAYFVCGPAGYMRMVQFTLVAMGVPAANLRRELFDVVRPSVIPEPPDKEGHIVAIITDGKEHRVYVKYPVSILHAARSANIALPFSCETGQCGTCVAKCLHGEVWMSRNEILLQEDIQRGRVLTCTGYPVNGDVTISI